MDLSPEGLARALRQSGTAAARPPAGAWRGPAPEPWGGPTGSSRQHETVGASGSRVTRVVTPLGTYCVRTPPPGQAPRPGAGPELALPTSCPD